VIQEVVVICLGLLLDVWLQLLVVLVERANNWREMRISLSLVSAFHRRAEFEVHQVIELIIEE